MFKFAASAIVASQVAAEVHSEEWVREFDVLPDELKEGHPMPQGEGRDHTEWSWEWEIKEAHDNLQDAKDDVEYARDGVDGAKAEYEQIKSQTVPAAEEHHRNCQLHREEEMNLYYQCTQNDINNYALHHFGGDERSYPRWAQEYNVCIDHLQHAKWLYLDYYHEDGGVSLEPCDPLTKTEPVYIGGDSKVVDDNVIDGPLDPALPCDKQSLPDWSGIWIEIWGGEQEAAAILAGNTPVTDTHTERCYTVKMGDEPGKATLLETWDQPGSRSYDLTKRRDDRYVENGCMIHTHLHGTDYTQWVAGVSTGLSMADQIMEQWHMIDGATGEEGYLSQHHEIRIGDCQADEEEQFTASKQYTGLIRHA